jgi:oxysterol-binding protein 1
MHHHTAHSRLCGVVCIQHVPLLAVPKSPCAAHAGFAATVSFDKCKGNLEQRGKLRGDVRDTSNTPLFTLTGSAMSSVEATPLTAEAAAAIDGTIGVPSTVYTRMEDVPEVEAQYHMTRFAIGLNDEFDPAASASAPTDSRRRTDMRCLENAQYEAATQEKLRLEDKQRRAAAARVMANETCKARWFEWCGGKDKGAALVKSEGLRPHMWRFNGEYWKAREAQHWEGLPDLYSHEVANQIV